MEDIDHNAMSPGKPGDEKSFLIYHEIMNAEQFTELTDHRESFNQDVLNGNTTKEEFLKQINRESDLLKTCEERIEQIMMENNTCRDFSSEVRAILSNRVNDLYILLFKKFDLDVTTISNYINICSKNEELNVQYKTVLDEVMHSFYSDPVMYITVANHVFNDCNDIESARLYIANGIQFHKKSKNLYIQDFWMEVKNLKLLGEPLFLTALIKYRHIIQHFENDIYVHLDLVDKAFEEQILCTPFQSIVIRDMVHKYRCNALMWQKMAKMNLNGFIYNFDTEMIQKDENMDVIDCIDEFVKTYNEALNENSSGTTKLNLWSLFLDDVIEIYNSSTYQIGLDIETFLDVMAVEIFSKAYSDNLMRKPEHFIFLANCLENRNQLAILKKGLSISKDNLLLWSLLLEYYLKRDLMVDAIEVLCKSVIPLKCESLPLWKTMESYIINTDSLAIEHFYRLCTIEVKVDEISLSFRTNYLEWCVLNKGTNELRNIFNVLKELEPKQLKLYTNMLQYSTLRLVSQKIKNKDLQYIKGLYSEACNTFGHMNVGIWNDCMRFEYTFGIKSEVDMIYNTALKCLENPTLKDKILVMKNKLDEEFIKKEDVDFENDEHDGKANELM